MHPINDETGIVRHSKARKIAGTIRHSETLMYARLKYRWADLSLETLYAVVLVSYV